MMCPMILKLKLANIKILFFKSELEKESSSVTLHVSQFLLVTFLQVLLVSLFSHGDVHCSPQAAFLYQIIQSLCVYLETKRYFNICQIHEFML